MPKASFLWHDILVELWGCPVTGRLHHISYSFTACIFYLALASFPRKPKTASNHYLAPLFINTYCHDRQRRCGIIVMVASSAAFRRCYSCCFPLVSQHLSWSTMLCPIPGNPCTLPFKFRHLVEPGSRHTNDRIVYLLPLTICAVRGSSRITTCWNRPNRMI